MLESGKSEAGSRTAIKERVREFYDSIGWREIGDGIYQNARYEDLRPVSRDYIHRCHERVNRYLPRAGRYILDAGSGPIQYPEYVAYSIGFSRRVCLDISILALKEARSRIGGHGLYVVGDIANLPFKAEVFDGLVSLHTVHHLPAHEHQQAFKEFIRTLSPGARSVVIYSWGDQALLVKLAAWPIKLLNRGIRLYRKFRGLKDEVQLPSGEVLDSARRKLIQSSGTFTYKHGYRWIISKLFFLPHLEVRVWRAMSTAMLRAFVHRPLGGKLLLKIIYWLEERFPHFLGRIGQYPMILFSKPAATPIEGENSS